MSGVAGPGAAPAIGGKPTMPGGAAAGASPRVLGQASELGVRFRTALLEQRATRLKGGLFHLNQVAMAYNSNRIEGSRLSEEQTRSIFETRTVDGPASVDDVIETSNHFRLFEAMLDALGTPLTAERIKEYHRILKSGTADAGRDWFAVGDWKRLPNVVGGQETVAPDAVDQAIAELLGRYGRSTALSFESIADCHWRLEQIHPFQDGNGRVGRVIMFEQLLGAGLVPVIVLEPEKGLYYRGLHEYADQPGYLRETLRHFQDDYAARYTKYLPPAGGPHE